LKFLKAKLALQAEAKQQASLMVREENELKKCEKGQRYKVFNL
jgi:hypothetical protein